MSENKRDTLKIADGKNPDFIRSALSGCRSYEDVKALGVLFHGSVEEISGDLHGGGYDNVFWTAHTPSVAQAYIPKSGMKTWIHKSYEDGRDDHLTPCHHDSASMIWALGKAGVNREDLEIEWNGLRPYSWTIPKNWPTDGDWDDYLEGLGYVANNRGVYEISFRFNEGQEEIMPANWSKPGQLIIALPGGDFKITDPEWSEDAMGYEPHNRVVDFADFADQGLQAFRMEDQLQSDFHGNVYHEAIGVLPGAIKNLNWMSIPCVRHDGEALDVFSKPETPEFITFMKDISPMYRSEAEIAAADTPIEDRKYAVMTDSSRPYDKSKLARMAPECSKASGFWTDTDPEAIWIMDRKTADDIVQNLWHNNPRVVRAEKAVKAITAQRDEKLALKAVQVEGPFTSQDNSLKVTDEEPAFG